MLFTGKNTEHRDYKLWSSKRCAYTLAIGAIIFISVITAASILIKISPAVEATLIDKHDTQNYVTYADASEGNVSQETPELLRFMLQQGGSQDHNVLLLQTQHGSTFLITGEKPKNIRSLYFIFKKRALWKFLSEKMLGQFTKDNTDIQRVIK